MPTPTRNARIQHLVNASGGKDSTATYLLALESGRPFRAVFADTGNEHELTYEYIQRLHERTGGPKVEVVRADFSRELAQHKSYLLREWSKQAQHLVRRCMQAVEAKRKVLIGFRLGDLWADTFVYEKGQNAGKHGVSLKARLLFISWIKVDGEQVYKAEPVSMTAGAAGLSRNWWTGS
ncbi:DUF3577 domain-containing protein [Pseudomonas aeruginosa]|uniref:DUF3577 domain-containing protein n=2 Tax=Pseudomonas aeruginosa TaxID=287 RepID=UPI0009A35329|nr:DUF3577 domain-containing protein [Pseudomonas aeruginosa]HBO1242466.1 DUF3577 domain-containing protein [Pseudomonas aeruginosa]HBO2084983.1 DUF3577 domain-containing protein [Pseudomonas aeruginosa]